METREKKEEKYSNTHFSLLIPSHESVLEYSANLKKNHGFVNLTKFGKKKKKKKKEKMLNKEYLLTQQTVLFGFYIQ